MALRSGDTAVEDADRFNTLTVCSQLYGAEGELERLSSIL
jgi:hypothetical protein